MLQPRSPHGALGKEAGEGRKRKNYCHITDVVRSHGQLEVVLGVLALGVLEVESQARVVDQNRQVLASRTELLHELFHRFQIRQIQLNETTTSFPDVHTPLV